MSNGFQFLVFTFLASVGNVVHMGDVPCAVRKENGGNICVCNGTYCDTVERPSPLQHGSYYHYMTSDENPGFTKTISTFPIVDSDEQLFSNMSSDVYIFVNATVQYQTFQGIGAALTDCSGIMINTLSPGAKQNFIESHFGASGLEYTFVRVPVAGADFSLRLYTYDDIPEDVELKYFNLTEEDFKLKIPLIEMAMSASKRGLRLIGSSWTAPSWMKTNNASTPSYLRLEYHQAWTNYYLKFLEAYKRLGIDFWALTQGNEILLALFFGTHFRMPNMIMLPAQASYWTKKHLGPMLKESGFKDVKLLTLDDERPFISWWTDRMFADEETAQYIDGVALHWYFDSNKSTSQLDTFQKRYPDKFLIYTESSINGFQSSGGVVNLGDWSRAVRFINNIYQNFEHWVIGYLDWNIALNNNGGPAGITNMTLDASVIINETSDEFYKQPMFYVLGHFSKFMPPGSIRIQLIIDQDTTDGCDKDKSPEYIQNEIRSRMKFDRTPPLPPPPPTTSSPFPTRVPDPPSNTVIAMASTNPDGSRTIIAYNPRSEPANLIVHDAGARLFNHSVEAHSLNSFIYWLQ